MKTQLIKHEAINAVVNNTPSAALFVFRDAVQTATDVELRGVLHVVEADHDMPRDMRINVIILLCNLLTERYNRKVSDGKDDTSSAPGFLE